MKKKIYICMSILMVLFLSLTMVHANESTTYRLSEKEMEMMDEYSKQNVNTPEFIQLRKEKAETYGLVDYCDENYILEEDFYDEYADAYLMQNGLMILDRYSAGFESSSSFMMARSQSVTNVFHHRYTERNGHYLANCLYQLSNSHYAFCAQGLNASPSSGSVTSDPYLVSNANLKKCLYYGYNGPGDILTSRYGESAAIVLTDELVSNAYSSNCISKALSNGYHWNNVVSALWNEVTSKAEPSGYDVYFVDVAGQAYNWQGVMTSIQKLAYGVNSPKGSVQIKKSSRLSDVSTNNVMYTLKDAKYGLYSDSSCTKKMGEFLLDEKGNSNVISNLSVAKYYVREISAPKGYAKNDTVYPVDVKSNQVVEVAVSDVPYTNLVNLMLVKKDKDDQSKPLKDAQYEFKFYDQESSAKSPLRTWLMKTDADGKILMDDAHKISGDAFYKDVDGMVCLPLGTITVQEVVPPKGYLLDPTIFVQKLEEKNVMSTHFNSFKYFNAVDKANSLKLVKVQEGTDIPLSNVTFKHFLNGSFYIGQDTTNEKGEIEFVALSSGKHTLQEFKTIDGYVLDASPIEFEVLENGSITGVNSVIKVENKVRPFSLKIQKKNDKNELLNGAVFGLFKDEKCLECVEEKTTQDGVVVFDGLKNKETYYVKEVKAPAGYRMNKQVYCLNTDFVPVNNQFDVYINQEKVNGLYENGTVNMEFINQRMVKLPHTGSAKVLFMSVMGMFLMAKKLKEKE